MSQEVIDGHKETLEGGAESARMILKAGGRIGLGGDYGFAWCRHGDYAKELTFFVKYVGFKTTETEVSVQSAEVKTVDIHLEVASQAESIVVTSDRPHGEAEAIERSRNTDNVVQVLSGEVIRSLPNANVADALGRLPSVTLFRDEGEYGMGYVNLPCIGAEVHLPFGGVKRSGNGHPSAAALVETVTHKTAWTVNHGTEVKMAQGLTIE